MSKRKIIRCAIYTRKSSEEGLDQEFNSLDAQYEACLSYVASQKHEGWKACSQRYDDGGISGGTLERPSMQRLLDDVDAGKVDMIIVYKIDRLTRSLADFVRLVERFDKANCSFVSVTQAFNTSSSMGRLTLNVLLSFAQFEREVTGERIRDKIAASKKKGMWMGGLTPLGYDAVKEGVIRKLVINSDEAATVRKLFELYGEYKCLRKVKEAADRLGLRSKLRANKTGGSLMSRGQIHFLLTNPIYTGHIRHKDQIYEGQHGAIITQDVWDQVQLDLQKASNKPRNSKTGCQPSLLVGKLFDEIGNRLTPSHTQKNGKRIRYYVSKSGGEASSMRLPAVQLEALIHQAVIDQLSENVHLLLQTPDVQILAKVRARVTEIGDAKTCVLSLINRTQIKGQNLCFDLDASLLASMLGVSVNELDMAVLRFECPFQLKRRGNEMKLVSGVEVREPDLSLVKAIAQAHEWLRQVKEGRSLAEIGRELGVTDSSIRKRIALAFLSPRITESILSGSQPVELTLRALITQRLPLDWKKQEKLLGFITP